MAEDSQVSVAKKVARKRAVKKVVELVEPVVPTFEMLLSSFKSLEKNVPLHNRLADIVRRKTK
jgi:hypothetical protein